MWQRKNPSHWLPSLLQYYCNLHSSQPQANHARSDGAYKHMHFELMLREPKYSEGAKPLYSTTSRIAINCRQYVGRKHSLCDRRCVAAGTAPRQVFIKPVYGGNRIYTASGAFSLGFLSCGDDWMLFALHSCARSLGKKAMIRTKYHFNTNDPFYNDHSKQSKA